MSCVFARTIGGAIQNASENILAHLRTRVGGEMKTTPWTIEGAFGLIGEIFDELSHAYRAWKACGCARRCARQSKRIFAPTNAKLRK